MKVLVVEDDPDVRLLLQTLVAEEGHTVEVAVDGAAGLDAFRQLRPQLVLSDIIMPHMEGLEFVQKVTSKKPNLPIVVMSGFANDHYLTAASYFGAVCKLTKPFETNELLDAIKCALERTNCKNQISTSNKY